MKKKTIIVIVTVLSVILFGISYSYAANNIGEQAVEGTRNIVGGAENVVEDAANGIANGVKNVVRGSENTASDVMNSAGRMINNGAMTTDNNSNNYTATRTSTTNDNATLFGMNSTTWAWVIMAILGIAIVAIVWYYGKQNETKAKHNRDNY